MHNGVDNYQWKWVYKYRCGEVKNKNEIALAYFHHVKYKTTNDLVGSDSSMNDNASLDLSHL